MHTSHHHLPASAPLPPPLFILSIRIRASTLRCSVVAIANATSVVSYQCAEERLGNALACFATNIGDTAAPPRILSDVRGQPEDYVNKRDGIGHGNVVDSFLSALASTMRGTRELRAGVSACEILA